MCNLLRIRIKCPLSKQISVDCFINNSFFTLKNHNNTSFGIILITILNPECKICDDYSTINNGTVYGYENSTAQAYAKKYGYNFESLGETPEFMISDIVCLKKWLIGSEKLSEGKAEKYDLNDDGKLNVFDWILLKRQIINAVK